MRGSSSKASDFKKDHHLEIMPLETEATKSQWLVFQILYPSLNNIKLMKEAKFPLSFKECGHYFSTVFRFVVQIHGSIELLIMLKKAEIFEFKLFEVG